VFLGRQTEEAFGVSSVHLCSLHLGLGGVTCLSWPCSWAVRAKEKVG
jgi:hypothetical protein